MGKGNKGRCPLRDLQMDVAEAKRRITLFGDESYRRYREEAIEALKTIARIAGDSGLAFEFLASDILANIDDPPDRMVIASVFLRRGGKKYVLASFYVDCTGSCPQPHTEKSIIREIKRGLKKVRERIY